MSNKSNYMDYKFDKTLHTYSKDVYLEAVLSLVGFMLRNEYCKETLINKIIPLISFDKTDFYLILEPYKTIGPYLVSDRILIDWIKDNNKKPNNAKIINEINDILSNPNIYDSMAQSSGNKALIYTNPQGALNEINEKRSTILNSRIAPQNMPARIKKIYEELFKSNIFPKDLIDYYNTATHKMYEDEFRFVVHQLFSKLENDSIFDHRKFDAIRERIYDYTNGPDFKPLLLRDIKNGLPPHEKIAEIRTFINSTAFFYIPLSFKTMENYPHDYILMKPNPNCISSIYNISKVLHMRCNRLLDNIKDNNTEIIRKTKKKGEVSDDNVKELLQKLKKEGKLDELMKDIK